MLLNSCQLSFTRRSPHSGKDLRSVAARLHKALFLSTGAALISGFVPAAAFGQAAPAVPPVSPEAMAVHLLAKRPAAKPTTPIDPPLRFASASSQVQGPGAGPRDQGKPGCDVFPAPPSIGTNVGLSYFGPMPSTVNPSLVGPVQLLNTGKVDAIAGTITIPLYKGSVKSTGKTAWYILTDVSDQGVANELGLNYSAKTEFYYRCSSDRKP